MILKNTPSYVVISKPVGLLSQSAPNEPESAVSLLSRTLGCEIFPIHRLDRTTSGIMVYAKTKAAAAFLSAAFAENKVQKEYLAIVHGIPEPEGEMRDLLYHRAAGNKSFVVDRMRAGVKEARLTYRTLSSQSVPEPISLIRVKLGTGRTHQVRVQFAHRAHPLLGDGKYGAHSPGHPRLHCASLTFPDPATRLPVSFSSLPSGEPWDSLLAKTQEEG